MAGIQRFQGWPLNAVESVKLPWASGPAEILFTMPNAQIAGVMQMNVISPITLTKYLLRSMMAERQGRIVNISSIVASTGYAGLSAYSASKAAMGGFTGSLAREVGSIAITVNAVAPGSSPLR